MAPIMEKLQSANHSPLKESRVGTHIFGQLHAHNASPMQQQNLRQPHHRHYFNTKENTILGGSSSNNNKRPYAFKNNDSIGNSSPSKHMNRGLEILDFRESWLEEMELYKDKMNHHRHYLNPTTTHTHGHSNSSGSGGHHHSMKQNVVGNTVAHITQVQPNQQQLQQLQQIFQYTTQNNCQHESHNCSASLANKPHTHLINNNNINRNSLGMGVIDHYNEEIPFEKSATPTTPLSNGNARLSPKRSSAKKREPQQQQQLNKNVKNSHIRAVSVIAAASPQTQLSNLNELDVPAPVLELLKNAEKQVSLLHRQITQFYLKKKLSLLRQQQQNMF